MDSTITPPSEKELSLEAVGIYRQLIQNNITVLETKLELQKASTSSILDFFSKYTDYDNCTIAKAGKLFRLGRSVKDILEVLDADSSPEDVVKNAVHLMMAQWETNKN